MLLFSYNDNYVYVNVMLVSVSLFRMKEQGIYEEFESVWCFILNYWKALNLWASKLKGLLVIDLVLVCQTEYEYIG